MLQSVSSSVLAVNIPQAAHQLDLRGKDDRDTTWVTAARQRELTLMTSWLAAHAGARLDPIVG